MDNIYILKRTHTTKLNFISDLLELSKVFNKREGGFLIHIQFLVLLMSYKRVQRAMAKKLSVTEVCSGSTASSLVR